MPHIPGHLTPFSQSLINQGMNQTNRLAANATNPPNITNPPNMGNQPYTNFSNNNMNLGGGNVMGGSGFGPGSDMLGVGNVAGSGYGGNMGQFDTSEGTQGHMGFGGSLGGDAYADYQAEQAWLASDEYALQQQGITTNPDGTYGIYSPWLQSGGLYGDVWQQSGMSNSFSSIQEALEAITNLQSLQELNEQGFYDEGPGPGSWDLDVGGFDFDFPGFGPFAPGESGSFLGPYGDSFGNNPWANMMLLEQGVTVNPDGTYSITDAENLYGDMMGQLQSSNTFSSAEDALAAIQNFQNIQGVSETPISDLANIDPGVGDPIEGAGQDFGDFDLGGLGVGGFDFGSNFGSPNFDWNAYQTLLNNQESLGDFDLGGLGEGGFSFDIPGIDDSDNPFYYPYQQSFIDAQQQAPINTGGGGQGGQAARKLYYPGTSGGFASVGSGIGGGNNTLQQLLKGMG